MDIYESNLKTFAMNSQEVLCEEHVTKTVDIIYELWNKGDSTSRTQLFGIFLGVNLDCYGINYKTILNAMVTISAHQLYSIQQKWDNLQPTN